MTNEYRKTSELKEWKDNPRSITKEAFERLKKHITDHGQMQPLVITNDGEVLGGNMRLKAYRELGINDIWIKVVEPKDENDKLRIALVLNDRAGFYDDDLLANLLPNYDIDWSQYSVDLKEPTNLRELLDQFKEVVEDEVPEVSDKPAVSKLGEMYQLGKHRLMVGDSTKIENVEKLMNGKKADMVFTDPPYNLETEGGKRGGLGKSLRKQGRGIEFISDFETSEFLNILPSLFGTSFNTYVFSNKELLPEYLSWIRENKLAFNVLVWKKPNAIPIGSDFKPDVEYLIFIRKNATWNTSVEGVNYSRVFECERETGLHPTMKPIELIVNYIKASSENGNIIIDLFGGSGSTLIACEQTNRICYMMEISPSYVDVCRKRYANFVGKGDQWQTETPKI